MCGGKKYVFIAWYVDKHRGNFLLPLTFTLILEGNQEFLSTQIEA
jgi:hypothetical protein